MKNIHHSFETSQPLVRELNAGGLRYPWTTLYQHSGFWVTHPDIDNKQYNVILFRKVFELKTVPESLIIHISADNLYRLFVNGQYLCMGPARDDLYHWRFETIDIAPFLKKGKNIIAAQVNNFGHNKAHAQFSYKTGLIISAIDKNQEFINSDDKTWKTLVNKAFTERPVQWIGHKDIIGGWYCDNPNDCIDGNAYPWGWQKLNFDDSQWQTPKWLGSPQLRLTGAGGPLLLEPRPIKLLEHRLERLTSIARTENITISKMPFNGKDGVTIPANSTVTILIDHKKETQGFPEMVLSKGKGSVIKVIYSECLFDDKKKKGNRDEIAGKKILGIHDIITQDGGLNRNYQALWYRAFRFIQLEIKTGAEALEITDFYNIFTAYPFQEVATFECDEPRYKKIWDVGMRTNYICAQDFYMSDAYYETMQYLADTRIHGTTTVATSGDYSLYRQAIRQINQSRISDGLTLAAYPNDWYWVLPYFSLMWVDMLHDYTLLTGDKAFAREILPGVRCVLDWFDRQVNEASLLGKMDWANVNGSDGNSSLYTLYYAYSLQNTAKVCDFAGSTQEATTYRKRAARLTKAVYANSWDDTRKMIADSPAKKQFTQWENILGILTDTVPVKKQADLMRRVCSDTSIAHVGYIDSFYMFEALKKTGLGELYDQELKPWLDQLDEGLTTFKEIPSDEARSDCHPWSTCPVYYFLNLTAGIEAVKPGFEEVRIAPSLGKLKRLKASMPTVAGTISVNLKRTGASGLKGTVTIPKKSKGTFVWGKKTICLTGGIAKIEI